MFEPQGAGFFLLLMVVFGGLLVWVALRFRVFAACLAFLPAMVFGSPPSISSTTTTRPGAG